VASPRGSFTGSGGAWPEAASIPTGPFDGSGAAELEPKAIAILKATSGAALAAAHSMSFKARSVTKARLVWVRR